ncbi:MAG: PGPGW domain-containing protein [Verrucomicrobiota bacterium]
MKLTAARNFRRKIRGWFYLDHAPKPVRRVIIGVIGGTILLLGVAMIILPGPAIVVIPLGLAVLATEYIWARRWLKKARRLMEEARKKVSTRKVEPAAPASKVSSEDKTLTLK